MAPLSGDPVIEGFYFAPEDSVLVDSFLRPKISCHSFSSHITAFMHDVDVYSAPPDQLAAEHEHAPTTGRKVWWWHPEGSQKEVKGSASGGYFKKFTYKEKTASGVVVKPGWLMVEYGVSEEHGGANLVLCKIYRSPRHKRNAEENHLEAPSAPPPTVQRLAVERLDADGTASVRQGTHTPQFPPEGDDIAALVFPGTVKYDEFSSGMPSPASEPSSSDELYLLDSSYIPGEDQYDEFSGGMLCPESAPPSSDELYLLNSSHFPAS
ncbi:hypothetical protein GUJ93_ZPchr0003g16489 [Zizania palustris]|uniref:NAC domain-containing protein n=1 Tax=Zizania palustris TaxID=103762 RepID=A0A8J5VWF7_ZIZPA|nr:hypothetical protein GUJ93_ZPchr0003g16489 [Zizania palustris]